MKNFSHPKLLKRQKAPLVTRAVYPQTKAAPHSQLAEPCVHNSLHTTGICLCENLGVATPTQTNAIWTGHILHNGERSGSYQDFYSVLILPWLSNPNDTAEEDQSILDMDEPIEFINYASWILIHEIGHQLGAYDHYCYIKQDFDGDGYAESSCTNFNCDKCVKGLEDIRPCVMGTAYYSLEDITNENLFCNDCIQLLNEHLSDHH